MFVCVLYICIYNIHTGLLHLICLVRSLLNVTRQTLHHHIVISLSSMMYNFVYLLYNDVWSADSIHELILTAIYEIILWNTSISQTNIFAETLFKCDAFILATWWSCLYLYYFLCNVMMALVLTWLYFFTPSLKSSGYVFPICLHKFLAVSMINYY